MVKKRVDENAKKALEELKFEIATELGITDAVRKVKSKPIKNIYATGRVADIMKRKTMENDDDFTIG
ncbi:MAG: small, acid-soluble spore protein, alpha/beta type [Tissierellia bacterium]|nr:small, acid-soluble spore protein, alpha/beta type [Tissierellia bacterium]